MFAVKFKANKKRLWLHNYAVRSAGTFFGGD